MEYSYQILDVFAESKYEGAQLAVVDSKSRLTQNQMQKIASEFGASGAAFITEKDDEKNTYKIRMFSNSRELNFSGTHVIGAAIYMFNLRAEENKFHDDYLFNFEWGQLTVSIRTEKKGFVRAHYIAPKNPSLIEEIPPVEDIAAALSLKPSEILTDKDKPMGFDAIESFLYVPIRNKEAIKKAKLNYNVWEDKISKSTTPNICAFTYLTNRAKSHLHTRVFSPANGNLEEAGSGDAVSSLSGYLYSLDKVEGGKCSKIIEQGFEIGRPSIIHLDFEVRKNKVAFVMVGGRAVVTMEGKGSIDKDKNDDELDDIFLND